MMMIKMSTFDVHKNTLTTLEMTMLCCDEAPLEQKDFLNKYLLGEVMDEKLVKARKLNFIVGEYSLEIIH